MMFYYNLVLLFILGLLVGSFLSVVINRLDTKDTIWWGRSKCPKCKAKISARDLIPVLSFAILRGKCRKCQKKIGLFYPIIEIVCAFLFSLVYLRFSPHLIGANLYLFLVLHLFIVGALLVIFAFDWANYIIPDKVLIPMFILACVAIASNIIFKHLGVDFLIYQATILNIFSGLLIGGGFFLLLVLISSERWMGWGDVKLGALLGMILGYPLIIVSIFSSFILGSLYGLILIAMHKKTRKDIIPFGPFLILGAFVAIFLGKYIIKWYLG